jgi:oligoribonuclease
MPILAGASVHFDRAFIKKYMWRLDRELSHRHFDVSTLRHFFTEMGFPHLGERTVESKHRAADDIDDSYKLARKYVNLVNILVEMSDDAKR